MSPRLLYALTGLNLVLLAVSLANQSRPLAADPGSSSVLRGQGLEIVDAQGKLRSSITLIPASTVNGKNYPETILFRLIDRAGKPVVKIGASDDGSGMSLVNERDEGIQLLAQDSVSQVRVTAGGRERSLRP
jgi:hypothetical protein